MNDLISVANRFFLHGQIVAHNFVVAAAVDNEWAFMEERPGENGVFASLIEKVEEIGASGYELMMSIGIIGLVFSILFTAVTLLATSNAQKKEEKKSHVLIICIAGVVLFGVFSIVGFFQTIGTGL